MLTIKMEQDKQLVITVPGTIYEKEANVDMIRFLIPNMYNDIDMSTLTPIIKYTLPSREQRCEKLIVQEELYKGFLDYRLNVSGCFTTLPGDVSLHISFLRLNMTDYEKVAEQIMVSGPITITIEPLRSLYSYDCTGGDIIDQLYLELNAKIEATNNIVNKLNQDKADDIEIIHNTETGKDEIWVTSNGKPIGDPILIPDTEYWEEL